MFLSPEGYLQWFTISDSAEEARKRTEKAMGRIVNRFYPQNGVEAETHGCKNVAVVSRAMW